MKSILFRWIAAPMVSVLLSGPAFAAAREVKTAVTEAAPQAATPTQTAPTPAPAPAPAVLGEQAQDESRYQERENQFSALANFHGGFALYIGGSVLVLALLIVLLVILL